MSRRSNTSSRLRNSDSPVTTESDNDTAQSHDSVHRRTRHREWSEDRRRNYDSPTTPESDNDSGPSHNFIHRRGRHREWSEDEDTCCRQRNYDSPPATESDNDSGFHQSPDSGHHRKRHRDWSEYIDSSRRRRNFDSPPNTVSDNDSGYRQSPDSGHRRRRHRDRNEYNDVTDDPSPKRPMKSTVDRISMLPDCVLVQILSFLPIEDAIKTDVLSKRWRNLWTCIPVLLFRYRHSYSYDNSDKIRDFVSFVNKTLVLCNGSKLKKFRVDFDYESRFAPSVNSWICRATSKGTEQLHLEFYSAEAYLGVNDRYVLPQILYNNSSFRELRFSLCSVNPKGVVGWNSLKKLSIGYVKLSEDAIQKILAGSPVLEIFELYDFYGFNRLHVGNVNLKKLILRGYWFFDNELDAIVEGGSGLKISAPNLISLEISGCFGRKDCWLVNVSSLVEATLNCFFISYGDDYNDDYEWFQNSLRGLLESLVHVKNLTLGTWALQVLSIMEAKGLCSPLSKCEYLTLDTRLKESVLPGIASLLESSPFLETLVINMSSSSNREYFWGKLSELYNFNGEQCWTSQKKTFKCLMLHLKTIKFAGLRWNYCDFNFSFVQFLLKNSRVLQKMIINTPREDKMPKELSQAAQKFLSFPRSSPDAVVRFYE